MSDAVTVLIEIHAKPGEGEAARDALVHAIATSVKPGFRSARVFEGAAGSGAFYSVQEWEDEASFRAHMSEARAGMAEATSMLSEPPRTAVLRQIADTAQRPAAG